MKRRTFLVATTATVGTAWLPKFARAADTIKIGSIYSLTGSYATIEDPALKGAKLAIKQVNDGGGVKGQKLELIQYDGKSTLADIANAAQRLVHEDQGHRDHRRLRFGFLSGECADRTGCRHSLSRYRRHRAQPARADRRICAYDAVRRRLSGLCRRGIRHEGSGRQDRLPPCATAIPTTRAPSRSSSRSASRGTAARSSKKAATTLATRTTPAISRRSAAPIRHRISSMRR